MLSLVVIRIMFYFNPNYVLLYSVCKSIMKNQNSQQIASLFDVGRRRKMAFSVCFPYFVSLF